MNERNNRGNFPSSSTASNASDVRGQTCSDIYTARSGDTLYSIAKRYDVRVSELMRINQIRNPYALRIGQNICIPDNGRPRPECRVTHMVAEGDTLYMIARMHNISLDDLMNSNPDLDPYNLRVGTVLCIPQLPLGGQGNNRGESGSGGTGYEPPSLIQPRAAALEANEDIASVENEMTGDAMPLRMSGNGADAGMSGISGASGSQESAGSYGTQGSAGNSVASGLAANSERQDLPENNWNQSLANGTGTQGSTGASGSAANSNLMRSAGDSWSSDSNDNSWNQGSVGNFGASGSVRDSGALDLNGNSLNQESIGNSGASGSVRDSGALDSDENFWNQDSVTNSSTSGSAVDTDNPILARGASDNAQTSRISPSNNMMSDSQRSADRSMTNPPEERSCSETCRTGTPYVVRRGETLADVLERFSLCFASLMCCNMDIDFSKPLYGLTLCIPVSDVLHDTTPGNSYIIRSGDDLYSVADKTGIPASELLIFNPCYTPSDFSMRGMRICLGISED